MENIVKICVVDEYNNIFYFNCSTASDLLCLINELNFIVNVVEYKNYQFKNKIEKCDYVLEEFIY